jgi:hypothetical protein
MEVTLLQDCRGQVPIDADSGSGRITSDKPTYPDLHPFDSTHSPSALKRRASSPVAIPKSMSAKSRPSTP